MIKINTHLNKKEFDRLAHTTDFNCVSIYYLIHRNITDSKNNFKLLIQKVEQQLIAKGAGQEIAQDILGKLEQLLNDTRIWQLPVSKKSKTFIVFLNENNFQCYLTDNVLDNCVTVTTVYYLLPLFDKASQNQLKTDSNRIKQLVFDENQISNRLEKIIPLAFESKIAKLYVSSQNGVYGVYDDVNKTTMIDHEKNSQNMSLINLAAIITYIYMGKVYLVDPECMPTKGTTIQAILK